MIKPKYIDWIIEEEKVFFEDGHPLKCYILDYKIDETILDEWAVHIRRHYISDKELEDSVSILSISVEQYLREYVIPQKSDIYGAVSRSNDISEILFSDLLEFVFGFTVPRCKQQARSGKTLSEHGTDIIAYKFSRADNKPNRKDRLLATEVKAQLTSETADVIKSAVKDSTKDEQRFAHTLDYYRKKLKQLGNEQQALEIARFQQKPEYDYEIEYVSAAISSKEKIEDNILLGITGEGLSLKKNQEVFYVHGKKLMELVHNVYERCIK